jgi:hypothetical protein
MLRIILHDLQSKAFFAKNVSHPTMTKNNKYFLQQVIDYAIHHLLLLKAKGTKRELSYPLQCGSLEDFNHSDIRLAPVYEKMFDELKEADGPVLYWFEIAENTDKKIVIEALQAYKLRNEKNTPALRAKIDYNTTTLYVGKVKTGVWGRVIQHLGFYAVSQTQGLQLYHWAKEQELCLTLHVLEFEKGMEDILPIFEYSFAKKLKPLIGKHS